jgi:rhodanese-related sulfurtransferase
VLGQVADETAVPRISVADLKKAADTGQVLIVDVRDAGSYAEGHLPGAINIPLDALQQKLATLKAAKKPIVAYCA